MLGLGPVLGDAMNEERSGDALFIRLAVAGGVDIGNEGQVGIAEAGGEFVEEEAGAAELVRLEDADEATRRVFFTQRAEGGADFGGVVAVVVGDDGAVIAADFTHPAVGAPEMIDGSGGVGGEDVAGGAGGNGGGGVEEIMAPGDGESNVGDFAA